jgi:hypothetical protein
MQTQTTETAPKPLPVWLSIPIILICLGGGGWIIHWYVMTDPISHESKILGDPPAQAAWQGNGGRNRPNLNRRAIQAEDNGRWELWTDKAHAVLTVAKGKGILHNITYMTNFPFVPEEARKTLTAVRSLVKDTTRITAMKLNVAQVRKLDALAGRPPMMISPADKELLSGLMIKYATASEKERPPLQSKVLETVDAIADRSVEATKKETLDRVSQIDKIMTPELWSQNAAMGGAGK